jgi:GAF domain-containing protein
MLAACAATLLESIDIAACVVVHAGEDGFDRVEACAANDDESGAQPDLVVDHPRLLDLFTQVCRQADGALRMGEVDDRAMMIAPTRYAGRINGAVGFLRDLDNFAADDERVWSEDDRHLLRTVAGQVGIAIAQIDLFERPCAAEAP